ncbi:hypothetical protein MKX03_019985 [Papaver bracteatum]|nr:hypothetical protein MKX03_019985 [Papaver bracteatum]
MAFASKLGSLARQNLSASNVQGSLASMYNAVRCMSGGMLGGPGGSKLFVGARVITDRETWRSMGFDLSATAVKRMLWMDLGGRQIRVSYANERPTWNFGGGGYNNGGGGYGDGGRNDYF